MGGGLGARCGAGRAQRDGRDMMLVGHSARRMGATWARNEKERAVAWAPQAVRERRGERGGGLASGNRSGELGCGERMKQAERRNSARRVFQDFKHFSELHKLQEIK